MKLLNWTIDICLLAGGLGLVIIPLVQGNDILQIFPITLVGILMTMAGAYFIGDEKNTIKEEV